MSDIFEYRIQDEWGDFENDISQGIYLPWLERYPEYIQDIFSELYFQHRSVNEEEIEDFLSKGLDLNKKANYTYNADSYVKIACIKQDSSFLNILLKYGAIPYKDVVMDIFEGSAYEDEKNLDKIYECLKVLDKYNVPLYLDKTYYDEYLIYEDPSKPIINEYIKDFVSRCIDYDRNVDVEELFGDIKNAAS